MNIKIVCVGKIKEKFYRDAVEEYKKRLSRYCNLQICEVADEKTKEDASDVEVNLVLEKEAARIEKNIDDSDYVIALAINGKKYDSIAFAKEIENLGVSGQSNICFIIGGSLGIHQSILKKANKTISFSDMTFPHQLMRVILVEQIYRGFRIIRNEPYHK